ncbi:MAG: HEAT repeat domain-containing protein [Planctomycetes bacterium]|nr:HEAT repeat domain-containing protein [Planctomycetota bacterium]
MSPAARLAGALAVVGLALTSARADDKDPEFEGQTVSKWIDTVQKDSSARKRALAVEALGKIWVAHKHKDVLPNVGRALRVDPSPAVRTQAAIVLAGLKQDEIKYGSADLVAALGTEKESRVRKEIVLAMSKFPEVCALGLEPLTASLKDPEPAVKVAAAEAIALAGAQTKTARSAAPDLVPLLKDSEKSVRTAAVYALGRIQPEGASTISETMALMLGTEKDADIKRELIASIGLLAEKSEVVVKALAAALSDKNDEVRRGAARTLGTFGTAAGVAADELFKVLTTDAVKDIRVDAVRAFGSALGPAGVKARLKDLRPQLDPSKQPDFEVRLALVDEIGALGYEYIGADLTSPDKGVKAEALETLGALRSRQADPQVKVREAAAQAVRKIEKKPEPKKEP